MHQDACAQVAYPGLLCVWHEGRGRSPVKSSLHTLGSFWLVMTNWFDQVFYMLSESAVVMRWYFCFRSLLASASKRLRQGCCLLSCLLILGICMATNPPLCWITGREITNITLFVILLLPELVFCWLIIYTVALSSLVLMTTPYPSVFTSFMAISQVLGYQYRSSLQPLFYYFFLLLSYCDSYFIHDGPSTCVTNLYMLASKPY